MRQPIRIYDPIGPILFRRTVHRDSRGSFVEDYHEKRYQDIGLDVRFVQMNRSTSLRGVLRGLHFQNPGAQGKLVSVSRGEVFDVAVDIRVGSPTFGRWYGVHLSANNGLQLWVPPDFAHGFAALSDEADLSYQCTDLYRPEADHTLIWDDRDVGIEWPLSAPLLSDKDAAGLTLAELEAAGRLPLYRGEDTPEVPKLVGRAS